MYDSPTAGKPLNLAHLVPGVQMIVRRCVPPSW